MQMHTSKLSGAALDWAVAKCEGLPLKLDPMGFRKDAPTSMQAGWWVWDGEGQNQVIGHRKTSRGEEDGYSPSTDWAQGGPIIEREMIFLWIYKRPEPLDGHDCGWMGLIKGGVQEFGPTPLVAAMRCFVASRLGEVIEVPDNLFYERAVG